jgi:hypothetical protein
MKFINLIDLLQVFANEYSLPGDNVLIVCETFVEEIKTLFNFINCETFFVSNKLSRGIDFVVDYNDLPFERNRFDIVINLIDQTNFLNFVKKDGFLLTKSNCCEIFYQLNATNFTVLQG